MVIDTIEYFPKSFTTLNFLKLVKNIAMMMMKASNTAVNILIIPLTLLILY